MRLLLLNISLLLLLSSCNQTQRNKTEVLETVCPVFDTLISDGSRVSVQFIKGVGTYLIIDGKTTKKINLKDVYNEFQIEVSRIDLNYSLEKAGISLYFLHSITNDFSFLINPETQKVEKVFQIPIIKIDTLNARCFYYDHLKDTLSFVIEDLKFGYYCTFNLPNLNDSIYFHEGFSKVHFKTSGALYLEWKYNTTKFDTIINPVFKN
jgi:hypothetical protein